MFRRFLQLKLIKSEINAAKLSQNSSLYIFNGRNLLVNQKYLNSFLAKRYLSTDKKRSAIFPLLFVTSSIIIAAFGTMTISLGFIDNQEFHKFIKEYIPLIYSAHIILGGEDISEKQPMEDMTQLLAKTPEKNEGISHSVKESEPLITDTFNSSTNLDESNIPKDTGVKSNKSCDDITDANISKNITINENDSNISDGNQPSNNLPLSKKNLKSEDVINKDMTDYKDESLITSSQLSELNNQLEKLKNEYSMLENFVEVTEREYGEHLKKEEETANQRYNQLLKEKSELETCYKEALIKYKELDNILNEKFVNFTTFTSESFHKKIMQELFEQKIVLTEKHKLEQANKLNEENLKQTDTMKDIFFMMNELEQKVYENVKNLERVFHIKKMKTFISCINFYIENCDKDVTEPLYQPFIKLLSHFRDYDDKILIPLINSISDEAFINGVSTRLYLVKRFHNIKKQVSQIAYLSNDEPVNLWSFLISKLHSLISKPDPIFNDNENFLKFNDKISDEGGLQSPHEVYFLLDKIELCLKQGNIYQAICYASHIKHYSGSLIKNWLDDAVVYLTTQQAINFTDFLLNRLISEARY